MFGWRRLIAGGAAVVLSRLQDRGPEKPSVNGRMTAQLQRLARRRAKDFLTNILHSRRRQPPTRHIVHKIEMAFHESRKGTLVVRLGKAAQKVLIGLWHG